MLRLLISFRFHNILEYRFDALGRELLISINNSYEKGYQNWASRVAYFIDFNFAIFAIVKTHNFLIEDLEFPSD